MKYVYLVVEDIDFEGLAIKAVFGSHQKTEQVMPRNLQEVIGWRIVEGFIAFIDLSHTVCKSGRCNDIPR